MVGTPKFVSPISLLATYRWCGIYMSGNTYIYTLFLHVHNAYKLSISYFGWGKWFNLPLPYSSTLFLWWCLSITLLCKGIPPSIYSWFSEDLRPFIRRISLFAHFVRFRVACRLSVLRSQRAPILIVLRALCGLLVASHALRLYYWFFSFLCRQKGVGSEFPSNG